MNIFKLISKLKKIRDDTYLTVTDQALYYELVSICNERGWKDVFPLKNISLCGSLNITEKTLIKSRKTLYDIGLIYFKSCNDKRIGCYYSFSTVISPVLSTGNIPAHNTGEEKHTSADLPIFTPVISALLSTGIFPVDKKRTTVLCAGIFPVDAHFSPYKRIKTINNRESLALTHEPPPPQKPKTSRKKEGDEKPLVYPFSSIAFMSTWETLRNTPKWKKKLNLALQMSLDKLSKYPEEFAIYQMSRAIESNWTGVVFSPGTDRDFQEWLKNGKDENNRKLSKSDKARILLEEYQSIASGTKQSLSDAEVLNF